MENDNDQTDIKKNYLLIFSIIIRIIFENDTC